MTKMIAAMLALFGLGACSLIDVKGPPARMPDHGPVECTDNRVAPITDTLVGLAGIGIGTSLYVNAEQSGRMGDGIGFVLFGVPALVVGLITGASAVYGYSAVSRCNGAKERWQQTEPRQPQERRQAQERAWMLTKTAAEAALASTLQ